MGRGANAGSRMRLPDELVENMLWSLGTPETEDGLRKSPRVGTRVIAMMVPLDGDVRREAEAREVCVREISADGASILLASKLRDARVLLEIPGKAGTMSIVCVVRRCDRAPEGGWAAGVQFEGFMPRAA